MAERFTIKEYESFSRQVEISAAGFHTLPSKTFDALEKFILENRKDDYGDRAQAWDLLTVSMRYGKKVISAKNYVGLITMNDGTTIEILPKLDNANDSEIIKVFRDMLSTVRDIPYKPFNSSNVKSDKMTLFEIFIRMFLTEVGRLIKRGLKHGYVHYEENALFLKGKIDFNQQIKKNLIHKERFYIEYDDFQANRPENKIIKSTLLYVKQKSHEAGNLRDCERYLKYFSDIDESVNYENDFAQYTANRNMMEYDQILKWCRIFLLNNSFTAFHGSDVAFALLFPMERLFESFVANRVKHHLDMTKYRVSAQDKRYYLFDSPKKFSIRPDIVVYNENTKERVILDTKWKMLSPQYPNYGISQGDMYQMYVYHKKYNAKKVVLVYPLNNAFSDRSPIMEYYTDGSERVNVSVIFFDLMDVVGSIRRIEKAMNT